MEHPVTRHYLTYIPEDGGLLPVRIMLVKYDGNIEVYYQMENFPFEFAFGIAGFEGFAEALKLAIGFVDEWRENHE